MFLMLSNIKQQPIVIKLQIQSQCCVNMLQDSADFYHIINTFKINLHFLAIVTNKQHLSLFTSPF